MAAKQNKPSKWKIFTAGIIRENPVLRLVLGCCSALAITTTVSGALGMGLSMTFVLVCSNIVISALRKAIPDKVHLPCYIVIIAAFVTVVQMVLQAYVPDLYESLGVFLALIVVNCIILGRAEMFACKHTVVESALDGLGMGLGYILTMLCMSSIREILGNGSWLGIQIIPESVDRMGIMNQAPGGFFVFGCLMALCIFIEKKTNHPIERKSCGDATIFFNLILVNNYVLVQFLGICPFLGVSKKLDSSVGMGLAVIFVMVLATAVTFPLQIYLLDAFDLGYMQTVIFILVIAVLVQLIEITLKKYVPALYTALGVYLPLITTNCCVLGVTILAVQDYSSVVTEQGFGLAFAEALVCAAGAGVGFLVAMLLFCGVRQRVEAANPPESFKGLPITLVSAAITSMSFMGFGGLVENIIAALL